MSTCKRGHVGAERSAFRKCLECDRINSKRKRAQDPARARAMRNAQRNKDLDRSRAMQRLRKRLCGPNWTPEIFAWVESGKDPALYERALESCSRNIQAKISSCRDSTHAKIAGGGCRDCKRARDRERRLAIGGRVVAACYTHPNSTPYADGRCSECSALSQRLRRSMKKANP